MNKIVNIEMTGGLIGWLFHDPARRLDKEVAHYNKAGWRVVQIIPSSSGNVLLWLSRIIFLLITLFLYTTANGYYILLESVSHDGAGLGPGRLLPPACSACGQPVSPEDKFCQHCGHKLS